MRTPRKLKKGARTLHGNPRTKWQRRAQRTFISMFVKIGRTAVAAATTWQVLEQGLSEFRKGMMVVGGITHPDTSPQASIQCGELVLDKEQQQKLAKILEIPQHLLQTDCVIPADALLYPERIPSLPPGHRLRIPPVKFKHD